MYLRAKVNSLMAKHTGRPLEQIERDFDRDNFMSAEQAVAYGIIDQIVTSREELIAPSAQPTATG
jgi:ATP-dependent Clp protease protease subunit